MASVVARFTVGYSWTPFFWLPEVDFTGVLRSLHAASNAGAFPLHKSCLLLRPHSATMVALFGEPSPGGNVGIVIFAPIQRVSKPGCAKPTASGYPVCSMSRRRSENSAFAARSTAQAFKSSRAEPVVDVRASRSVFSGTATVRLQEEHRRAHTLRAHLSLTLPAPS